LLVDHYMDRFQQTLPTPLSRIATSALLGLVVVGGLAGVSFYFGEGTRSFPWAEQSAQARFFQSLPPGSVAYVAGAPNIDTNNGTTRYLGGHTELHDLRNLSTDLPQAAETRTVGIAFQPHLQAWANVLRLYYPTADVRRIDGKQGRLALLTMTIPPQTEAVIPSGGLRGEIRPLDQRTPAHVALHPALAFRNLRALARAEAFTGRWEGSLIVPEAGDYQFRLTTDGAVALDIDGHPVLRANGDRGNEGKVTLLPGRYPISISGQWQGGSGVLEFYWQPPGREPTLVPPSALQPPDR
jgi:hypothetical protein